MSYIKNYSDTDLIRRDR